MLSMGLIVSVVALLILNSVINAATNNNSANSTNNFSGPSATIVANIMPITIVGLLVVVAYVALGKR